MSAAWDEDVELVDKRGTTTTILGVNSPISATPYAWIDPERIPRRRWLYAPHYIRQFLSLTVSTGGVGKSSLVMLEAMAMASGKPLLNIQPAGTLKVWYWNGEDPLEELQRRMAAAAKHYGLTAEDLGDRLFVDTGREMPIVIATDDRRGVATVDVSVVEAVTATINENGIDVVIIDPFVTSHRVSENDNGAIERVAKSWSQVAEATNCAVMLVHHSRKTGGEGATVDDGRGASALLAAARTARTLNTMRDTEADNAEVDEQERRLHFRCDIGKANLTPPAETAQWFKLVSVDLENAEWGEGDEVGVVTPWEYPQEPEPGVDFSDILRAQAEIAASGPWREDQRATQWVGIPIARALGVDLDRKPRKRAVVKLIKTWLAQGWLSKVVGQDEQRHERTFVEAGSAPVVEPTGRG